MRAEVSVVVPSHDRPLRLRWLLNALEEQTLPAESFEVVVVHDSRGPATDALLRSPPLTLAGRLRWERLEPGTGTPGRQRNVGWRMASAPLVAFTDDDCRPEPEWLAELLARARATPGALIQGRTRPDPYEHDLLRAPSARSLSVDPPGPYAQTANMLYPREALERCGGFDERLHSGEDIDLALRARELGYGYEGAPNAIVNHAVEALSMPQALRVTRKWADLAHVLKRHPHTRSLLTAGVFWRPSHGALIAAAAGLLAARRFPLAALLVLPYLRVQVPGRPGPRSVARGLARTPGRVVVDAAEIATCARGSVRHRTLWL